MYLVSPTGEEKEKQSMKRKKKKKKQSQGDLAEARGLSRGHSRAPATTTLHVRRSSREPFHFCVLSMMNLMLLLE